MTFSSVSDGIADLGGMNVRYELAYADTTYLGLDITSEFSDLARERVANVEKDYNCTVELVHGTGSFGTLVASTYAGTYLCDILCADLNYFKRGIRIFFHYFDLLIPELPNFCNL